MMALISNSGRNLGSIPCVLDLVEQLLKHTSTEVKGMPKKARQVAVRPMDRRKHAPGFQKW